MNKTIGISCCSENNFNIFSNMFSLLRTENQIPEVSENFLLPSPFGLQQASVGNEVSATLSEKKPKKKHRRPKKITACPHIYKKHYARNMCNACYHRFGREKNAWSCKHVERKHYAKGKCEACYIKEYMSSNNS
ncbi:unnamed protein product [Blepharisma stoltei]|uniref:Uncharacterized protein n=1 Tax=Blepharisma stoltei TaxID=1481888 RepID=A0AAU9JCA5_9CILI|nr:unnamed protein product [Blepharisma stoltei]